MKLEKLVKISIENKDGESFEKKEIVLKGYSGWMMFLVVISILVIVFREELSNFLSYF